MKVTVYHKVSFYEMDPMQVVWHGEYVRYLEDGREAFGRRYPGIGYLDFYNSCGIHGVYTVCCIYNRKA